MGRHELLIPPPGFIGTERSRATRVEGTICLVGDNIALETNLEETSDVGAAGGQTLSGLCVEVNLV